MTPAVKLLEKQDFRFKSIPTEHDPAGNLILAMKSSKN